jgi:nucleoside-diphosphate-sugar epimerase
MILVTGATGLVGSHLLYQLCKEEDKIRAIRREKSNLDSVKKVFAYYSNDSKQLFNKIEWVQADLLHQLELEEAFHGITKVYHCAAWVSFNPKHKQKMIRNNVESTANMVNLCLKHQVQKLCHVSSVAAIGRSANSTIIDENSVWFDGPENSNYAISKYNSELEVWRGIEEGLDAVIVNPTIILGPGNWERGSSVMLNQVWKGMPFYTTGTNGFVDVRDVVSIMIKLMQSDMNSERFILCSESIPFKQMFDFIAQSLNKKKPQYKSSPLLTELGWRLAKLFSTVTRRAPLLTKETARASSGVSIYKNDKIKKLLNYDFIPVEQSAKDFSKFFLEDQQIVKN